MTERMAAEDYSNMTPASYSGRLEPEIDVAALSPPPQRRTVQFEESDRLSPYTAELDTSAFKASFSKRKAPSPPERSTASPPKESDEPVQVGHLVYQDGVKVQDPQSSGKTD